MGNQTAGSDGEFTLHRGLARAAVRAGALSLVALATTLAARNAGAQTFPIPFPLPPVLPPISIDTAPASGRTEPPAAAPPPSPAATPPPIAASAVPSILAFSRPDDEALRLSRIHERWYGWQTLACDAAAVAVLLVGAAADTKRPRTLDDAPDPRPIAFAAVASGIYLAGPTAIHIAHGDVFHVLASAGLRVALPLAGFALGSLAAWASHVPGDGASADRAGGAILGGVGAMIVDASALGHERWSGAEPVARAPLLGARGSF
jgi:hypothetical protein